MKLYTYFRSSAAYRVRIALNLKGLDYEMVPIHLTRDGGKQFTPDYKAVNVQARVPSLELPGGEILTQSLAIIDYLDETHPQPPFLPRDPVERARIRAVVQAIACDIHPLNNLAALKYIKSTLGKDQPAIDTWYRHWILLGFEAVEAWLRPGPYSFGSEITLADICLVPQVANARRFDVPLENFPKIVSAAAACLALPAFDKARPENQPDAE